MARQFRTDDTQIFHEWYGSGVDGAYAPSTGTDAPIDSTASGTSGAMSLTATNASFAANQVILIHQSQGTGAGQWELNVISSYATGTITTKYPLQFTYGTGAQVLVVKQYTTASIGGGVTITGKAWGGSTGGIYVCLAKTSITISGTLTLAGKGFRGSPDPGSNNMSDQGEGYPGAGATSTAANGNGAGGVSVQFGLGGGNGTNGGTNGSGNTNYGTTSGSASLVTMVFGGGGSAGSAGSNGRTAGTNGGGIIILISPSIDLSGASSVTVAGTNATSAGDGRAGGAGAGGSVLLKGQTINIGTSKISAAGGSGASGTSDSGSPSGAGGNGRIHADYSLSFSGTAGITPDTSIDYITVYPKTNFFYL